MCPEYEEGGERWSEGTKLIRGRGRGEEVTFEGNYYQTRKAKLYTPPASPIPLYYSALSPRSAEDAGRYGDGLITVGGKQPDLYKQILKDFERGAKGTGKNPAQMPRMVEVNVEYT